MTTEPAAAPAPVPADYLQAMRERCEPGGAFFACNRHELLAILDRFDQLEEGIRAHRSQKADDRCVEDDDRLYAVLGDGIKCDGRVGNKEEMLANCKRFIERRCEVGGWPTYREIESLCRELRNTLAALLEGNLHPVNDRAEIVAVLAKADDALQGDRPHG